MSVDQQIPVSNLYGNNSATEFPFEFYIENEEQLLVEHTDLEGNKTTLEYGIDYSISEFKNKEGAFVTFPLQGSRYDVLAWDLSTDKKECLTISLTLPIEQPAEYNESGDLNKKNLEYSLDYLTRLIQIYTRIIERCVKVPEGSIETPEEVIANVYAAEQNCIDKSANCDNKSANCDDRLEKCTDLYNQTALEHATAIEEVTTAKDNAINQITLEHNNAISNINTTKENSVNTVQSALDGFDENATQANINIDNKKTAALYEIETRGADKISSLDTRLNSAEQLIKNIDNEEQSALSAIKAAEKAAVGNILDATNIVIRNWKE